MYLADTLLCIFILKESVIPVSSEPFIDIKKISINCIVRVYPFEQLK